MNKQFGFNKFMEKLVDVINLGKKQPFLLAAFFIGTFFGNVASSFLFNLSEMNFFDKTKRVSYFSFHMIRYFWVYIIIYVIVAVLFWKFHQLLKTSYGSLEDGTKATGRWTNLEEIPNQYKAVSKIGRTIDETYEGKSGTLISRMGEWAYIDTTDAHNVIRGRTRSGKGQGKVLPDLDLYSRSEEKPHLVVTSTKYELLTMSYHPLVARGYEINVLNLIELEKSMGFNPLTMIIEAYQKGDEDSAVEFCKTFSHALYHNKESKDPVWEDTAMALVNACILSLCHEFIDKSDHPDKTKEFITMYALVNMLVELGATDNEGSVKLDNYFANLPLGHVAKLQYATVQEADGQMRSSIFASTHAKLSKFTANKVAKLMSESTFDFNKLIDPEGKPQAIFLVLPDYTETNYIIATTWLQQEYYITSEYSTLIEDKLPRRIRHVIDEFGNLPAFSQIESILSVGAGRGSLWDFYIQDDSQLFIKYGEHTANLIISQGMNQYFIGSGKKETRENFSQLLGQKEVTVRSRSGGLFTLHKQITESVELRDLIKPEELGRLRPGETVIERSSYTRDLNGDPIEPFPIFNTGPSRMTFHHEYLKKYFSPDVKFRDLPISKSQVKEKDLVKFSKDFAQRIKGFNVENSEPEDGELSVTQTKDTKKHQNALAKLENDDKRVLDPLYNHVTDTYHHATDPVTVAPVFGQVENGDIDIIRMIATQMYPGDQALFNHFVSKDDFLVYGNDEEHKEFKKRLKKINLWEELGGDNSGNSR